MRMPDIILAWRSVWCYWSKASIYIFLQWLIFGLNPKWALFQSLSARECEVILGWSFFLFALSPVISSFSAFFTLDGQKNPQHLPFLFNSCLLCVESRLLSNAAQAENDWTVLFGMFLCILLICRVKFCPFRSCVSKEGPAQSSLATLCITWMQMSYETIHLREMPPWFQFESCSQSHCVSPLLHVKEVSLCEIRGG